MMRYALFAYIMWAITWHTKAQPTATDHTDVRIFPSAHSQHEVHISINKTNPNNLIVSSNTSNGQGYYFTMDEGITWNGSDNLPNNGVGCCDPSTSFDAVGRGYITTLTPNIDGYNVQHTINGGISWSQQVRGAGPTSIGTFDKEMIATVDEMQTSPYTNNFYCAWTDFSDDRKVKINRSTDQTTTFDNPQILSGNFGQGVNVQTGPNGEVYACWADYPSGQLPAQRIGFASSLDGGQNYTSSTPFNYSGIRLTNVANGFFGGTRVNDFPSMAVDKSCGPHRGRIYIAYPEFESQGSTKSVIRVRFSDDNGQTWSSHCTINIANGRQNWFPWIVVDDLSGLVSVIYYSFDQSTGTSTNTYVAYSIDGTTWDNVRISDAPHNTAAISGFAPGYAGDYIGIASFGGVAYGAWMDNRTGNWQVYVSKISFDIPTLTSSQTNLVINNPSNIYGDKNFQAAQKIRVAHTNSVTIKQGADVEMVAGESIRLQPGLSVEANATYVAKIEQRSPCTTPGATIFQKTLTHWNDQYNTLKEESEGVRLFAYPNVATDFITIGVLNNNYQSVSVNIYNIQGKQMATFKTPDISDEQIRQIVDVSNYPTGTYVATIDIDNKKHSIQFIKQ